MRAWHYTLRKLGRARLRACKSVGHDLPATTHHTVVDCSSPSDQQGYVIAAPATTQEDSVANVTCATGYAGDPSDIVCLSSGSWEDPSGCAGACIAPVLLPLLFCGCLRTFALVLARARLDVDGCTLNTDGCGGSAGATCSDGGGNTRTCTCAVGFSGTATLTDAQSFAGCGMLYCERCSAVCTHSSATNHRV